jgi:hypothetical protein
MESKYKVSKLKTWKYGRGEGGFSFTLLRDGRPVADVVDQGHGGPLDFCWYEDKRPGTPLPYSWYDAVGGDCRPDAGPEQRAFMEYSRFQPKWVSRYDGTESPMTPEIFAARLVENEENLKKFRRQRKTHVVFVDGNKLFTAKCPPNAAGYAAVRARYGTGVRVLNAVSDEEYLAATADCM